MELQLGLALPNANTAADHDHTSDGRPGINLDLNVGIGVGYYCCGSKIQQYHDVEGRVPEERTTRTVPRTLPLLHWASREGKEYADDEADVDEYMDTDNSSYHQPNRGRATLSGNSNYVKVSMEGIGIGRKVDLSLHHSFHSLKDTLLPMFGIYNEDSDNYKLAYQERGGGHWVIAGDSSWRNFMRSAQRLKIVKI